MSFGIFALVLLAAFLHAAWNAVIKGGADKALSMSALVAGHGIFGTIAVLAAPMPNPGAWPFILASVALHVGYQEFLKSSYKIGDLTQVYPIARGAAPLLVAVISVWALGVDLSAWELLAIALIACGIISLSLVRRHDGQRNAKAAGLAVITGCFIAGYSLVDGWGAREAGTAVGFFGWVAVLNAVVYVGTTAVFRPQIVARLPRMWGIMIFGGGASFAAYTMVVYAFLHAPIALVTALRETSIVFALLIGVAVLNERLDLGKLFSTMMAISGVVLMRLSKG